MKHELIVPKSDRVHRLVARETLRFCSSKEYTESEFDFPVVLGKDKKGELIIVDLPLLGNTVIYGPTGGPSFYEGVLLAKSFSALPKGYGRKTLSAFGPLRLPTRNTLNDILKEDLGKLDYNFSCAERRPRQRPI